MFRTKYFQLHLYNNVITLVDYQVTQRTIKRDEIQHSIIITILALDIKEVITCHNTGQRYHGVT